MCRVSAFLRAVLWFAWSLVLDIFCYVISADGSSPEILLLFTKSSKLVLVCMCCVLEGFRGFRVAFFGDVA